MTPPARYLDVHRDVGVVSAVMNTRALVIAGLCAAALAGSAQAEPVPRVTVSIKAVDADRPAFSGTFEAVELRIDKEVAWHTDPDSSDDAPTRCTVSISVREADDAALGVRECRHDTHCPRGEQCVQGVCRPATQP
jgi:hypothetical protein